MAASHRDKKKGKGNFLKLLVISSSIQTSFVAMTTASVHLVDYEYM